MPRAFGRFHPKNPTLDCVCDDCNRHFGSTVEREMGRDSLEALFRVIHGTKPVRELHELGRKRLTTTLSHDEPAWNGTHVEWVEEEGHVVALPVPQVAFRRRDGRDGWVFITERDLKDTAKPLPAEADEPSKGMRLIAPSKEVDERLIAVLAARGIPFKLTGESGGHLSSADGAAVLDLRGRVDENGLRCVSKIAFNYVAWCQHADFVLLPTFNPIRSFIRHGTLAPYPLVVLRRRPILTSDTEDTRQTNGHLVAAAWTPDNKHIVGEVSLFNSLTYVISVARDFEGVWRPLRTGHHFEHKTGKITLLVNEPLRGDTT